MRFDPWWLLLVLAVIGAGLNLFGYGKTAGTRTTTRRFRLAFMVYPYFVERRL